MSSFVVKRFTQLPLTLFRIQPLLPVNLRNFEDQQRKGRASFDLKTVNGLVHPAVGNSFTGPNGMSLRPSSDVMRDILVNFRGSPLVYQLPTGLVLPEGLVILHEHSDHYSLQTTMPISLPELNAKMTTFLTSLQSCTKEQFLAALDDIEDQDC